MTDPQAKAGRGEAPSADGPGVAERLADVQRRIVDACRRAGRDPAEVTLVAVGKRHPPERLLEAVAAGQRHFGESYAQEMADKRRLVTDPDVVWHFIGRIQRNKAGPIAAADLVHGVGKAKHLEALAQRGPVDVLLQVNTGGEEQKNGFSSEALARALPALLNVAGVRVRGLMTLPPQGTPAEARVHFAALRTLRDRLEAESGAALPVLSMGMTADFEVAILEGASHVRVGTALFGPRPV